MGVGHSQMPFSKVRIDWTCDALGRLPAEAWPATKTRTSFRIKDWKEYVY